MPCTKCGGTMLGDGYMDVVHCEYADEEDYKYVEPDGGPIYCRFVEEPATKPIPSLCGLLITTCWVCGKEHASPERAAECAIATKLHK